MQNDPESGGQVRIGELSRRVGVSAELLRAWERRYGLLSPTRTAGGFRLYGDDDERRVRRMLHNLDSGLSAAEGARLALTEADAPAPERTVGRSPSRPRGAGDPVEAALRTGHPRPPTVCPALQPDRGCGIR